MTESLVLPQSARDIVYKVPVHRRHPGLQLDKLSSPEKQKQQYDALAEVTKAALDENLLASLQVRRNEMLAAARAACHRLRTQGPLTLHLSRSGTMENAGIALHPVYGFTYLPGSGIKGLARAWAETVWAPAQADTKTAWRTIDRAFGCPASKAISQPIRFCIGKLIVSPHICGEKAGTNRFNSRMSNDGTEYVQICCVL